MKKLKIGKEYWVLQQNVVLIDIQGDTAVCRNRWDAVFECDIGCVLEKPKYKKTSGYVKKLL